MIRAGLIGDGLGGQAFHAPLIRACARLELAGIATRRSTPHAAALIADPTIGLIVISTPNVSHYPLARAALEAGKHVVIDKPFTVTVAETDDLIAHAKTCGRMLTVFHNRRWDGDFLTVQALLDSGRLGDVTRYEAFWDRFRPAPKPGWREAPGPGAGLLDDLGPHLIDQALCLFGSPDRVEGDLARQRTDSLVDDYFLITLHYGARRVLLGASLLGAAARPRFALHGTGGSFVKSGLDPQEAQARSGMTPQDDAFGVEASDHQGRLIRADGTVEAVPTRRGNYLAFYDAVASAILDGAPAPVDPADARAGLAIIAAVRAAA